MKINYELKYVNGDATNTHLAGSQPIDQSITVKHITELIWLAGDRSMLSIGYVIAKQQRIILLAFTVLSFLYNLHTLFISFYSSYIYFIYVDNITKQLKKRIPSEPDGLLERRPQKNSRALPSDPDGTSNLR